MAGAAVETRQLTKRFGALTAVDGVDLQVEQGTIFGLLGPNGAGKTTTLRLLNGTLRASAGTATVLGAPAGSQSVRAQTATLAELAQMYHDMSVIDNLLFYAALYDLTPAAASRRAAELLAQLGLQPHRSVLVGALSTGLRQRLQLARVLLHEPRLLFLDEPTSSLDPDSARGVVTLIHDLARSKGTTVILSTHNLPLAERICDGYGFISHGRLVAAGSREQITGAVPSEPTVMIRTAEAEHLLPFADEAQINELIRTVMQRGEHVTAVDIQRPSLEEAYFHFVDSANG